MVNYNTTYVPGSKVEEVAPAPEDKAVEESDISMYRWIALAVALVAASIAIYMLVRHNSTVADTSNTSGAQIRKTRIRRKVK
jgi:hypothetical protein